MGRNAHNRGGPRSGSPRRARRRRSAKRRALQAAALHAREQVTPPEPPTPEPKKPTRLQLARRWFVGIALILILGLSLAGFFGYLLARATPAWWRTVTPDNPETVQTADILQNALTNQFTAIRQPAKDLQPGEPWRSEPWRFAVEVEDANAWLNTSLPKWIDSDPDMPAWPEEIRSIQVAFRKGLIFVGIQLDRGNDQSQYLAAAVRPQLHSDGSLWIPADTVLIGRLPIPPEVVLAQAEARVNNILSEDLSEQGQKLLRVFRGKQPIAQEPVFRLGDGRQVRILDITPRNRRLIITCQTEQRTQARSD